MDLTEVAQLCFQAEVVEAKIQGVVVDSEDKISLEMDFLLWGNQSSPVNITVTHIPALPTPCYCCSALIHLTRWNKSSVQSRLRAGVRLPRDKGCRKEEDKTITFLTVNGLLLPPSPLVCCSSPWLSYLPPVLEDKWFSSSQINQRTAGGRKKSFSPILVCRSTNANSNENN